MRTLLFLLAGVFTCAAYRFLISPLIQPYPMLFRLVPFTLTIFWFGIVLTNMIIGITRAGYGAGEEIIIALVIFIPSALLLFWPALK